MARKRRHAKSRLTPLTREQWEEVTDGLDSPLYDGRPSAFETPLLKRAAWVEHRDAIVAAFEQMHEPYVRPECFWLFDAPKDPRRVVGRRAPDPSVLPGDIRYNGEPTMEGDLAFLERHGLATAIEIACLAELRQDNAARPEHLREHPDALGRATIRKEDWDAHERAATDAA